jgi:hypothetical protein
MADSVINYSDLIGKDDTFDVIFANIEKLKKELNSLAEALQKDLELTNPNDEKNLAQLVKRFEDLKKAQKTLDVERKKAIKTRKKLNELTDEELIQREKQKIADRERVQIAKQTAILRSKEVGQVEKLRAQLSLTTIQWKKLTAEEIKNNKVLDKNGTTAKQLIKRKRDLTNQLKKLERQTGDNRRNVGNYSSALRGLNSAFVGLGGSVLVNVSAFASLGKAIVSTSRSLGVLKTAIAASGIGVLVVLLSSLGAVLKRTQAGVDFVKSSFAGLSAAVDVIIDRFADLGSAFGALFRGEFTEAFEQFKNAVSGTGAEISEEFEEAKQAALELQQLFRDETNLIVANAEKRLKIAELERKAEENKKKDRNAAASQLREAIKLTNELFNNDLEIEKRRVAIAEAELARSKSTDEEIRKVEEQKANILNLEAQRENTIRGLTRKLNSLTKAELDNSAAIQKRIDAITNVQKQIEQLSAEAIADEQERLLRLEELKAKALREQQEKQFSAFIDLLEKEEEELIEFYGDNSKEVLEFREQAGKELLDAEAKQQELSEAQLKASERRKLEIRKEFAIKEIDVVEKTRGTENDVSKKAGEEAAKNAKDIQDEQTKILLDADTANKVGAAIVDTFNKQAELASSLVEDQADAVETQRQRAEQGLSNTLAFEQEQLAQREAERLRAEKAAKQAAELLTLFNLVSAYAASGDTNALAKGLVDFSILKALESGFEEGGYTGDDGKKQIAGVVHGQEYVVTAEDTKRYGLVGRSGADFGEAMSDYFYSPLQQNMYPEQTDRFKKNVQNQSNQVSRLENEVREMRRAFERMPKNEFDMVQITDHFVEISKRVTQNRMSKISKHKKRL